MTDESYAAEPGFLRNRLILTAFVIALIMVFARGASAAPVDPCGYDRMAAFELCHAWEDMLDDGVAHQDDLSNLYDPGTDIDDYYVMTARNA